MGEVVASVGGEVLFEKANRVMVSKKKKRKNSAASRQKIYTRTVLPPILKKVDLLAQSVVVVCVVDTGGDSSGTVFAGYAWFGSHLLCNRAGDHQSRHAHLKLVHIKVQLVRGSC